jgi:hypothetical protein
MVTTFDSRNVDGFFLIFPILLFYTGSLFLAWLYSAGRYIAIVGERTTRLGYKLFRAGIVYWFFTLWVIFPTSYFVGNFVGDDGRPSLLSMIILLLYGIEVVVVYYVFGYMSKLITDAYRNCRQDIVGYIVTFVGLMALPVGIWFIQPKVNSIWREKGSR